MALILGNGEIDKWVAKGTAWRFEHAQGALRTLIEVAAEALSMVRPKVRRYWLDAVSSLTPGHVAQITDQLPGEVSEVPRNFMREVVAANRRRVLDGC